MVPPYYFAEVRPDNNTKLFKILKINCTDDKIKKTVKHHFKISRLFHTNFQLQYRLKVIINHLKHFTYTKFDGFVPYIFRKYSLACAHAPSILLVLTSIVSPVSA